MTHTLYFGDNLKILTGHGGQGEAYFPDSCVDLVYLDPPFNSNRSYNVLFKDEHGAQAPASIRAFEDTWNWAGAVDTYNATLADPATPDRVRRALEALHDLLGASEMMAYLAMMTPRLLQLHRVLKPTGSLYLHCDPTASHYLKIVLDAIFGPTNFRNEIIWKRTTTHNDAKRWSPVSDVLLYFVKSQGATWNPQYAPHSQEYLSDKYRLKDVDGRLYQLDNMTSSNPRPNMTYEWKGHAPPPNGWRYSRDTMAKLDAEGRKRGRRAGDGGRTGRGIRAGRRRDLDVACERWHGNRRRVAGDRTRGCARRARGATPRARGG